MGTNATILLGLAVFVLAIFGSAWLNLRQIEKIIDSLKGELKAEIKTLDQKIDSQSESNNQRFSAIESRLDRIERQLDSVFKPILK